MTKGSKKHLFFHESSTIQLALISLIFLMMFCTSKRETAEKTSAVNTLALQYTSLQDSVQHAWNLMIADDDDKHLLMHRLLLEVSYTNHYDKEKYKALEEQLIALKAMRYDQNSMAQSSLIDQYDSATFALSDEIISFARSHPRFDDTPMMAELINDINSKNNYILIARIHYDKWAKELNAFVEQNADKLSSQKPALQLHRLPLFELPS